MTNERRDGDSSTQTRHVSVLRDAVSEFLAAAPAVQGSSSPLLLDGTLGGGGHAESLLARLPSASLIGVDRDQAALARSRNRLDRFSSRITFLHANFGDLPQMIELGTIKLPSGNPVRRFDALLLDLGLSSDQLDDPSRGFSFRSTEALDMRMDRTQGVSAGNLLNTASGEDLARIFRAGDLRRAARPLARAVERNRPFTSAAQFAAVCEEVLRPLARRGGVRKGVGGSHHPATLPFQALRMAVNDELGSLERFLEKAPELMTAGARLAVISFHSLEDEIVTRTMRRWSRPAEGRRGLPVGEALGKLLTREAICADAEESSTNPRARSARLRVFERREGESAQ